MSVEDKVERFLDTFCLDVYEYPGTPADLQNTEWFLHVGRPADPSQGLPPVCLDQGDMVFHSEDYEKLWQWLISDEGKAALLDVVQEDMAVIEEAIAASEEENLATVDSASDGGDDQ